jgi:Lon protease-like protein
MSDLLPLFPLPKVVLFPNVFLPLHIFEPRYREMVADSLKADRLIGMVLLRPGWDRDYDGCPPVYPIGSSGVITHVETLQDGRYNIVLRGLERFRILEEDHARSYRRGVVEPWLDRTLRAEDRAIIRVCRSKLQTMLATTVDRSPSSAMKAARPELLEAEVEGDPKIPAAMPDEDLINALAQYLDLEPIEKQALLETPCLRSRAESLVELLEMKIMTARTPGLSNVAH